MKEPSDSSHPKPPAGFTEHDNGLVPPVKAADALRLVGKTVLLGVTYLDHDDSVITQKQWFGTIREVSQEKGIVIGLDDTDEFCALPPMIDSLRPAAKGEYRIRSTGRVVTDPDFTTTWTNKKPPPGWKKGDPHA